MQSKCFLWKPYDVKYVFCDILQYRKIRQNVKYKFSNIKYWKDFTTATIFSYVIDFQSFWLMYYKENLISSYTLRMPVSNLLQNTAIFKSPFSTLDVCPFTISKQIKLTPSVVVKLPFWKYFSLLFAIMVASFDAERQIYTRFNPSSNCFTCCKSLCTFK